MARRAKTTAAVTAVFMVKVEPREGAPYPSNFESFDFVAPSIARMALRESTALISIALDAD